MNSPQYDKIATTPTTHLWSFLIVASIVLAVGIYYYLTMRKLQNTELPKGLAFLIYIYIEWVRNLTMEMLGKRYEKLT